MALCLGWGYGVDVGLPEPGTGHPPAVMAFLTVRPSSHSFLPECGMYFLGTMPHKLIGQSFRHGYMPIVGQSELLYFLVARKADT